MANTHGHSSSHSHGPSHGKPGAHAHHAEAHTSSATYFAIFIALVVLTAISFGIGMYLSALPKWIANLAMVTVSCAKAMLVILFFMHLLFEANWKYVLTFPAAGMSLFLVGMLYFEFHDRSRTYAEERWIYAAEPLPSQTSAHGSSNVEHGGDSQAHGANDDVHKATGDAQSAPGADASDAHTTGEGTSGAAISTEPATGTSAP